MSPTYVAPPSVPKKPKSVVMVSMCSSEAVIWIRCDLTVVEDSVRQDTPSCVMVPPSDMHRHLGRLLSAGDWSDVTFDVDGERFAAHRYILAARSPVFAAELFGPMKENNNAVPGVIRIGDMEAKVFEAMLHFVYTDSLPQRPRLTARV